MSYIKTFLGVSADSVTIEVLKNFISRQPEEDLHLEFKSGAFFDANKKDSLTQTVTSFANSDGGILMLGVKENNVKGKSYADSIDGIQVDPKHSNEALENILISSISPKIDSLQIIRLDSNEKSVFILEIPKSERAPHMASDKRYYKRLNFQKVPMENYEVEDHLFGRKKTPKLTAKFNLSELKYQNNYVSFSMEVLIRNLGRIIAKYVIFMIEVQKGSVVSPLPQGFRVIKKDQNETTLQLGPSANGALPVVIMPSPSCQEQWTTLGKLTLQAPNAAQTVYVSYRLMHEELPETTGEFSINVNPPQSIINNKSYETVAPNEKVLY